MSPCQRSLKKLRAEGWLVAIVEHWNPWSKTRNDLFGFGDLLAIQGGAIMMVQTTSGSNMAARIEKIKASQAAAVWLESTTRIISVHGWARRGERKLWTCKEVILRGQEETSVTAPF